MGLWPDDMRPPLRACLWERRTRGGTFMKHQTMILPALLCIAGCASSGVGASTERLALYKAHATPVESFRTAKTEGRQVRWSAVGEQAALVYDESGQAILLEFPEACSGLANAGGISLTNNSGTVTPGTDSVRIVGASRAGAATSCKIGTASRIDMDAVKAARK